MSRSGSIRQFLDVTAYQILAIRNYLRHFKKGVGREFLPKELEVQKDWELNTYSLVFLVVPAFEFMRAERENASAGIAEQIRLNMSRLEVLREDLKNAYTTYCGFSENSPNVSVFRHARPWLISDVEQAIFRCDKWLERINESRFGASVELWEDSLDPSSVTLWGDLAAPNLPSDLLDIPSQIDQVNEISERLLVDRPAPALLSSELLSENPLLQVCMASRRLIVRIMFSLLTNRHVVHLDVVKDAGNCLRVAIDAIRRSVGTEAGLLRKNVVEGIRLLEDRLKILCVLCDSCEKNGEVNPAVGLLLFEQRALHSEEWTEIDRLMLAIETMPVDLAT